MSDLIKKETMQELVTQADEQHKPMLQSIEKHLPAIAKKTQLFAKTQSQFMDNFLTVSKHTPLRNARQCLAEVDKAMGALQESYFKNKKKVVEIKILKRDLLSESDDLKQELIEIEIDEKQASLFTAQKYVNAAIRKVNNYMIQYNTILANHDKEEFTEEDFEKEEEGYHISTAFDQAITAARARGGSIDEGNHIYFSQIGVSGASAQADILALLNAENEVIKKGGTPSIQMKTNFLDNMIIKYKGVSEELQKVKKMQVLTHESLIKLIEKKENDHD